MGHLTNIPCFVYIMFHYIEVGCSVFIFCANIHLSAAKRRRAAILYHVTWSRQLLRHTYAIFSGLLIELEIVQKENTQLINKGLFTKCRFNYKLFFSRLKTGFNAVLSQCIVGRYKFWKQLINISKQNCFRDNYYKEFAINKYILHKRCILY